TISNCTFIGNRVVNAVVTNGGGVACYQSDTIVTNCVFSGNDADRGGGLACYQSDTTVTNCTFSNNTSDFGGAFYSYQNTPIITSSIMWGNLAGSGSQIYAEGSPSVIYSAVEEGWGEEGTNNISSDPLFIDADGADNIPGTPDDDLHLNSFSLCINAGDPNYRGQFDIDGGKRIRYQRVDIGAYEVFPIGGDLNSDDRVELDDLILFTTDRWLIDADLTDFAMFGGQWGYGTGPINGDLNSDDRVDMDDLLILVADDNWLVEMDLYDFSLIAGNWLYGVNE
ncbi:MAG: right-handed parallel beta-helix repeat-containing protein, partial [Planctomycetota bacterium]